VDAALALAASATLSLIVWQTLDPRAVVFFALAMGFAELFIVMRWRMSISCPKCGFDPVLYKKNPEAAAARVKRFMEWRREDPLWVLAPPPKLRPIVKKAEQKTAAATRARANSQPAPQTKPQARSKPAPSPRA
jgi:hypothetical protein